MLEPEYIEPDHGTSLQNRGFGRRFAAGGGETVSADRKMLILRTKTMLHHGEVDR